MVRSLGVATAAAALALFGVAGIQGTGHASGNGQVIDCLFTVTAAGNGQEIFGNHFATVVGTLQTGEVFDLYNTVATENGIDYWNDGGLPPAGGDWYPIHPTSLNPIYMLKDENSCSIDTAGE